MAPYQSRFSWLRRPGGAPSQSSLRSPQSLLRWAAARVARPGNHTAQAHAPIRPGPVPLNECRFIGLAYASFTALRHAAATLRAIKKLPKQPEDTIMFPSLSRLSEPLLGAGQPTASSGPPRDKRSLGFRLLSGDKRRPGVIRIRVLTTATAATPLQPHPRETARSGTARPTMFPQRASLLLRHHPKSLQGHAHSTRLTTSPRRAARGLIGLQAGPRIHRRSLPGHTAHHHPGRKGRNPSDPPIISGIGGEGAGSISASRSETNSLEARRLTARERPQCVTAVKADLAVSADNTTTPVGTPKRDSDSAMQETPYSPDAVCRDS